MRRVLFFLALLLTAPWVQAQQENDAKSIATPLPHRRPKIGVALEGGGALGLAHIGVLKWFEEHHIPVDYVAGTSMGGLVGGFYATGMDPDDLHSVIESVDWRGILGDRTPYEDLAFRRKEDQRAYPNSLILGLRGGLSLPPGLNSGHQIGLLIDRVTLPYYQVPSFNQLPIPFRCVATDLVSGTSHVFENGSLAVALRSTMSIPGAFSPVRDGQAVYVDGGLLNNLPTDVVRQMGADIVIAVHLEIGHAEAKNLQSLFSVLEHSVSVVLAQNELRGLAGADAIVSVPLADYDTSDYDKHEKIMQRGYEAANDKTRLLTAFSIDDAAWQEYEQERNSRKLTTVPAPQFIKIEGTNAHEAIDVARYLKPFQDRRFDSKHLNDVLTRLTGQGRYDAAGYRMIEENGQPGLVVEVVEKSYAPPTIQPAFEVDGSQAGNTDFTMGTRLTFMDVAGFRSEWRTDLLVGNTYGIQTELFRPFTAESRWFFAPHADASDITFPIYAKNDPLADYRIYRTDVGMDLGYSFGRFGELRVGYQFGSLNDKLRLGTPQIPAVTGSVGQSHLHYLLDHTDDPVIPRSGFSAETNFRWFDRSPGAKDAFPELDLKLGYFQPVASRASIFFEAQGGTTFSTSNTGIPQFFLGAPLQLSAYGQNEFQGNQYYLFRTGYLHDLVTLPPFLGKKVYAVADYEIGKMYGSTNTTALPNDVAAGLLAETALGPFFIGGSVGDSGHRKWFFQLGRVF